VAFLELLAVAARAWVIATDVLQGIAHRLLRLVVAVRAMHVAMVMRVVAMIVIVVAVWAMDMGLLGHCGSLR
jgi:hypothetical protein